MGLDSTQVKTSCFDFKCSSTKLYVSIKLSTCFFL